MATEKHPDEMSDRADPEWPRRAAFYGDGVFRTMLVLAGEVVDRDRQLAKLVSDASRIQLETPDMALLEKDLDASVLTKQAGVVRAMLYREDQGRGYAPASKRSLHHLQFSALPEYPESHWTSGIDLGWSDVLLGIQPLLAGIKHLNRLEQVLASDRQDTSLHEMLMCDAQGRVVGGIKTNIFFQIDSVLVTPDLSLAGVAGAMRDKIIETCGRHGAGCEIGLVSPDEVRHAEECFVSNSLIGIWPVRRISRMEFLAPGPVTRQLMQWLDHPWKGQ